MCNVVQFTETCKIFIQKRECLTVAEMFVKHHEHCDFPYKETTTKMLLKKLKVDAGSREDCVRQRNVTITEVYERDLWHYM